MALEEKIALNVAVKLSDDLCKKITSKTIRWMQSVNTEFIEMEYLKNLWDDVCYQVQKERSFYWCHYDDMVVSNVVSLLAELEDYEVNAIWLQTDEVYYQLSDLESHGIKVDSRYNTIDLSCYMHDIAKYITEAYVYNLAESWRNDRIQKALERSRYH